MKESSGTRLTEIRTLDEVIAWLRSAPAGTLIPARTLAEMIERVIEAAPQEPRAEVAYSDSQGSWREHLWAAPSETRLGVAELCQALGKTKSWVYARTQFGGKKAKDRFERLPHRKLGGALVFVAGEIRTWIREREESRLECLMEPPSVPGRGGLRVS